MRGHELLLDGSDGLEQVSDTGEALLAGSGGHLGVHARPLLVLALGGGAEDQTDQSANARPIVP